jgi:hypothetical protein
MIKLGDSFSLGVSLAAAAFQAAVQQNANAINDVTHAKFFFDQLLQNGVNLDPFNRQIGARLQNMINTGNVPGNLIEIIRDDDLDQAYNNLGVPVLLHAYHLGIDIGGAESWTITNDPAARNIIRDDATGAALYAATLSNDTPVQVPLTPPLNVNDIPGELRALANQAQTSALSDLRQSLIFVRGKCQGILDITPENF